MNVIKRLAAGVGVLALTSGQVLPVTAAGLFPGLPAAGGTTYCGAFANGVCVSTIPAGPAVTGEEMIPADTGLSQGQVPQTVGIPSANLVALFQVNRLVGPDFNTNLAQRLSTTKGIASLAGITPTAAVMTADGWWEYSGSGTTTTTIANGTTEVLPALGTTKALRFARTASTAGAQQCIGQTLDQNQAAPLIGNNAVFSFWELNGSTMNSNGLVNGTGSITVQMSYSSAAAAAATQATLGYAGSQGSKYAIGTNATTFGTGGPTSQTAAVATLVAGTPGTIGANQFVTIPESTTWGRDAVSFAIPATIPGTTTAVTDVSVEVCFTSQTVSTTSNYAAATDWIELQGLQLEAKPAVATANFPNGIQSPSLFERRPASIEALIDYSYWYYNFESQSLVAPVASCENAATTGANCLVQFPVPMRIAPAMQYTAGFQAFAQVGETSLSACSALATASTLTTVPSPTGVLVGCTASVGAAGTANQLLSLGTTSATGIISASALP